MNKWWFEGIYLNIHKWINGDLKGIEGIYQKIYFNHVKKGVCGAVKKWPKMTIDVFWVSGSGFLRPPRRKGRQIS